MSSKINPRYDTNSWPAAGYITSAGFTVEKPQNYMTAAVGRWCKEAFV